MQRFFTHPSALIQSTAKFVNANSRVILNNARVDDFVLCCVPDVHIGRFTHVGSGVAIHGGAGFVMEDMTNVSSGSRVFTSSDTTRGLINAQIPAAFRGHVRQGPVRIEAYACVFTQSVVLPNVTIGQGAIVNAMSLVKHDLEPWTIYGGNPLRVVGKRDREAVLAAAAAFKETLE